MKNAYVKKTIRDMKQNLPPNIFKCPLIGEFKIPMIPARNQLVQMLPVGEHEMKLDLFDVKTKMSVNVSMYYQQTLLPK